MSILPFHIREYLKNVYRRALDFLFPQTAFETHLRTLTLSSFISQTTPCHNQPPFVSVVFSYKNPFVRRTILTLKYRKNEDAAILLGKALYDLILEDLSDTALFYSPLKPLLIPIPSSASRLKSRGYNQVRLITDTITTLDKNEHMQHLPSGLIRIKDAPSQTKVSNKTERQKNLQNAFQADPALVSGKIIILVDDVVTTGATLKEARRALKRAGAQKIRSYALAH